MDKNKIINLYFVTGVMMELLHNKLDNMIFYENNVGLQPKLKKANMLYKFKENHRKVKHHLDGLRKAIDNIGDEYSECLSLESFDAIRNDSNFLLRCIMHIYNAYDGVDVKDEIESILSDKHKFEHFSQSFIKQFNLR